jgi:hypothetical protein
VTIERVVYFRHFSMSFQPPDPLTYVLFGFGDEAHMTNCQTKEPDFDHIVSLAEAPDWLPPFYEPDLDSETDSPFALLTSLFVAAIG